MAFFKSFRELTPQRRLLLIAGIGAIAILFALYFPSEPEVVVAPNINISSAQDAKNRSLKPVMPAGYQQEQTNQNARNPFALPPGLEPLPGQAQPQQPPPANASAHSAPAAPGTSGDKKGRSKQMPASLTFRLTGIASADGAKVAVIQSGGKSKTYQLYEDIGAYRLVEISDDFVVLNGPDGERVLHVEAASPKGGDRKGAQ